MIFNLLQYALFHSTKANLHQHVQNALYRSPLRFENDKGTFDVRDYRKDNPLGFENLALKWIEQKKRTKVKPKTINSYNNFMNKAIAVWGPRNIKTIGTAEVEDFLFADHRTPKGEMITDKTRHNIKSCLHQFFVWVKRREKAFEMPELPEIEFELGWRRIVSIEIQQSIIDQVKLISWDVNPKRLPLPSGSFK